MNNTTTTQLARLKRRMQTRGVTQKAVAERAQVSKFHVCHVLAGRVVSAPVIRATKELLEEAANGGA